MKRTTLAAVVAIAGTTSLVSARRLVETREYATPTVLSVVTGQTSQFTFRAVSGVENKQPYLVIEQLAWSSADAPSRPTRPGNPNPITIQPYPYPATTNSGTTSAAASVSIAGDKDLRDRLDDRGGRRGSLTVRSQRAITAVTMNRQRINLAALRYVTVDGWKNGRFTLTAISDRKSYRCTLTTNAAEAACEGTWEGGYDGGGINPGPVYPDYPGTPTQPTQPPATIERLRAATTACNNALSSSSQRETCIKIVYNARVDLVPALAACRQALSGSEDLLTCLNQAASFPGDPVATIGQCAKSFSGSRDTLTCMTTMATQQLPLGVIPACDRAVSGTTDRFRCMNAVAKSRVEPVALIDYCRENTMGSTAVISCIEKYRQ